MNLKTNKHHRLAQRPWRLQFTSAAGRWCQPCSWLNENKRVRDQKPKLQRIGGHRPRLLDRRIFQMTLDGRRPYWGMVGVRISRALRKLRVQKCRRIHTRTVARPWFELASPQVIPVEHFPVTPCLEQSALNTWNAVEDIWCRLDVICQAIVSMYDDRVEVEFADAGTNDWDQNSDITIYAVSLVGTPYRHGGNTPDAGFDCSGLIGHVFKTRADLVTPRTVRALQYWGQSVQIDRVRTGDVVVFAQNDVATHAGIYVGEGRFVHAPSTGGAVRLDHLNSKYWSSQRVSFRRP